jgi:hypothetical protein
MAGAHGLVIHGVDRDATGAYHVAFGCLCGEYTAEETRSTEADARTLAANRVRIHEATETGAQRVDIRF